MNKKQKTALRLLRKLRREGPPFRLRDGSYGNCRRDGTVGSGCALTAIAVMLKPRTDFVAPYDNGVVNANSVRKICEDSIGDTDSIICAFDARINEEPGDRFEQYRNTRSHAARLELILLNIAKYGKVFPKKKKGEKCLS